MTALSERGTAAAPSVQAFRRPGPGDSLLIVVAITAVSTSGPLIAACTVASLVIAFWRNAFASLVLWPISLVRHRGEVRASVSGDGRAAYLSGLLLALHFGTWIPSISLTTVASSTALVATQPVWSALLARASGAHISRAAWAGIGISVLGAALVTGVDISVSTRALEGDLLAVVGGAFAAAYVQAGSVARQAMSTTAYTSICYLLCAVLLLAVCAAGGLQLSGFSARNWVLLAALTVGPQLLGHSVMNRVLRATSPTVLSLCILFEVPGASLIAYLWLHQTPSVLVLPGIALLVLGVAVVVRGSARPQPALTD